MAGVELCGPATDAFQSFWMQISKYKEVKSQVFLFYMGEVVESYFELKKLKPIINKLLSPFNLINIFNDHTP